MSDDKRFRSASSWVKWLMIACSIPIVSYIIFTILFNVAPGVFFAGHFRAESAHCCTRLSQIAAVIDSFDVEEDGFQLRGRNASEMRQVLIDFSKRERNAIEEDFECFHRGSDNSSYHYVVSPLIKPNVFSRTENDDSVVLVAHSAKRLHGYTNDVTHLLLSNRWIVSCRVDAAKYRIWLDNFEKGLPSSNLYKQFRSDVAVECGMTGEH